MAERSPRKKLNILWIMTDQQSADAMSCAGNPYVTTPHMDRLAAKSLRFDNTYCTYPVCAPSRASLFTGVMPHEAGVMCNTADYPIADAVKPQVLGHTISAAGYDCYYGGKWHVQEHAIPDQVHGFTQACLLNDNELPAACRKVFNSKGDKPFFLVASFDNPHNILEGSRDTALPWGNIERVPLEECPNLPANFAEMPYEPEAVKVERRRNPFAFRGSSYNEDDWRRYRYLYYRLVEKVDARIGEILDALDAAGLLDTTAIIFTADHGDCNGAHQWNQKWVLYEEAVRVPLMISLPGSSVQGQVDTEHLISNGLDLYPTVCELAGAEAPADLRGRSLVSLACGGKVDAWRKWVPAETWFGPCLQNSLKTQGRMIRTSQYKYVMYAWGKHREQLFDLSADPGEMINLAIEDRFKDVLEEHRALLAQHMQETNDQYHRHYAHPDALPPVPGAEYPQ